MVIKFLDIYGRPSVLNAAYVTYAENVSYYVDEYFMVSVVQSGLLIIDCRDKALFLPSVTEKMADVLTDKLYHDGKLDIKEEGYTPILYPVDIRKE